jgi:hypothetical protein
MAFSDRIGITKPKALLQIGGLDDDLRNCLWQACIESYLRPPNQYHDYNEDFEFQGIVSSIYVDLFKRSSDNMPHGYSENISALKQWFFVAEWWEVYNFMELLIGIGNRIAGFAWAHRDEIFQGRVDYFLEREKSGYRLIDSQFVQITDPVEVQAIEQAVSRSGPYAAATEHIRAAVALFSKKPEPDYRNAIKEAISAVESTVRILTGDQKATLGDALGKLNASKPLHPAFRQAMDKLYGYTSDEGGIRHSLIDLSKVDEADAKFMIVTCSAFVNFCVQRS